MAEPYDPALDTDPVLPPSTIPEVYARWIAAYAEERNGNLTAQCGVATQRLVKDHPELERVRGGVVLFTGNFAHHWWCITPDGTIIDPTAAQFTGIVSYHPRDESQPAPTGKCPNCGEYCYDDNDFCSKRCERSYLAYLNGCC